MEPWTAGYAFSLRLQAEEAEAQAEAEWYDDMEADFIRRHGTGVL